jgi:hypothetical protein
MKTKDFSILFEKVNTSSTKKDISFVDGYNYFVQQIELILKSKKGEILSDKNMGTDIYSYQYNPRSNRQSMELLLRTNIEYSIKKIFNVQVNLQYSSPEKMIFEVSFDSNYGTNTITKSFCTIEVPLI